MFQLNQLIIIGGPSFAGKTFLIDKIRQGEYSRLCEQLGIATPSSWLYVNVNKLSHINQPIIERLVVHYDLFAQYSQKNGFNYLHKLISNSDSVTILTLCVSSTILIQRINLRIYKKLASLLFNYNYKIYRKQWKRLCKLWKKRKIYKDDYSVFTYDKWFNFFNTCSVTSHWILDFSRSNITMAHLHQTDKVRIINGVKEVMDSYRENYGVQKIKQKKA